MYIRYVYIYLIMLVGTVLNGVQPTTPSKLTNVENVLKSVVRRTILRTEEAKQRGCRTTKKK